MAGQAEAPVVTIVGERIALGPIRRDLLPTYQRWLNDLTMVRNLGEPPLPLTLEAEGAWFDRAVGRADSIVFTFYERDGWRPLGNTSLFDLDYRQRIAEFGIFIGEADCRGKGYGTEVARLMLDYAFTALGLHNVMLRVHEHNLAGRRAYAKAGFRECGRRREARRIGGRVWDTLLMDCLATEFVSPVLGAIFAPDVPRTGEAK